MNKMAKAHKKQTLTTKNLNQVNFQMRSYISVHKCGPQYSTEQFQ